MLFSGSASVPFTVDGASETENPKETPKPEEVVLKQRGVLEVVTGYELDCPVGRENCPK
jgi:hypothetical protein